MELKQYLSRIGFADRPAVDLATLRKLHRLHLQAIPYENLDVQFCRPVDLGMTHIYPKLVDAKRGGWCYEMNGLLGWALEEIGFTVTRVAGAVMREQLGDEMQGNHLVLWVQLDQPYLADVGLGDGLLEPIPIVVGEYRQHPFTYSLEKLDTDWWRFRNQPQGGAPCFDFQLRPASAEQLWNKCHWLQTSPESMFVQNALCLRLIGDRYAAMRGRSLKYVGGTELDGKRLIESATEYREVLSSVFGLRFADNDANSVNELWKQICIRHDEYLRQAAAKSS